MSAPFDVGSWQRNFILHNVAKDSNYTPYCMCCKGLVRVRVVARHYWRCHCGAQCDYRQPEAERGGAHEE